MLKPAPSASTRAVNADRPTMRGVLVEVMRWVAKVTSNSDGGGVEDFKIR